MSEGVKDLPQDSKNQARKHFIQANKHKHCQEENANRVASKKLITATSKEYTANIQKVDQTDIQKAPGKNSNQPRIQNLVRNRE